LNATKPPRRLGRKLLLSLTASVLTLLLCEPLVRLVAGEQPKFPRRVVAGPFGLRINEPGAVYRQKSADVSVWFRINSKGMRADREYPYEKPAGVRRIVCLGDSFTAGYEVAVEDCFASVLERELAARGHRVEVLNSGVSGFGTAEECLYLERELIRYAPDVVVLSFYGNDLADNVRSDLFELEHGKLVQKHDRYVPLGGFGDFLNSNAVFGWLSERSDAFALAKEATTRLLKGRLVEENLAAIDAADGGKGTPAKGAKPADPAGATATEAAGYPVALTVALLERLYAFCRERQIALVIQSIPSNREKPPALVDLFPKEQFKVDRAGLFFQPDKELLDPALGKESDADDPAHGKHLLYWKRSTGHWTPYCHAVCGKALADRIEKERLLVDR
jgi:hypothetical protein